MHYINYLVKSKFARGTDGHLDANDLDKAIKDHDGSEAYYNHYDVREDALKQDEGKPTFKGAEGVCRPAYNLVGFDFDADDIADSLTDVKAFLNYFKFEKYYVAFSGSKGFHVSVPFEYFNIPADENLPKTLNKLAHLLKPHFPTLDTQVYNIGRKFRALNTKHPKTGLYKTIVSGIGLQNTVEVIKDYASKRRDLWYDLSKMPAHQGNKILTDLLQEAITSASYDKEKAGSALAPTRLEEYDEKVCIKRLLESRCPEGERNTTALIIINDIFKTGKLKDVCYERVIPWARSNGLPVDEVNQMIEDIYSGNRFYNHGCLEQIKAKKCSVKCKLYSKLAPDKRPTPVDAPKGAFKELETKAAKPATAFINDWLKENKAVVSLANNWYLNNDLRIPIPRNIIEDKIFNASDLASRKDYKVVSQNKITAFLNEWESRHRAMRLDSLRIGLAYTGDNDLVTKFLKALLVRDPSNLEVSVLKHWLWLVKRKLAGDNVERELMIVVAGITNTGKTQAVTRLFKPVKELVDTMMLDQVNDERHDFRLVANAIVFFDEMAVTRKVNVNALKNKITAKWLNYRPLGKTSRVQGRNFASFIGTSNNRVNDIIKDPTSSRRYFEYWVDKTCDWDAINSIDYVELWRGIDEDQEVLYIHDFVDELKDAQESFRALDSVEEWLEVEELVDLENHNSVPPQEAYTHYTEWMKLQFKERASLSKKSFFNIMNDLELAGRNKKSRYYKIKRPAGDVDFPSL